MAIERPAPPTSSEADLKAFLGITVEAQALIEAMGFFPFAAAQKDDLVAALGAGLSDGGFHQEPPDLPSPEIGMHDHVLDQGKGTNGAGQMDSRIMVFLMASL